MDFFKKRIYLDYASSTPLDRSMLSAFPVLSAEVLMANPSALHKEGQAAQQALARARTIAAEALSAHSDEIIFTSNATESDNIALQGAVRALLQRGLASRQIAVMTTDIEHAAVLETVAALAGTVSTIVLPTEQGLLDVKNIVVPEDIQALIVSVMYVNNEIGTVQDIPAIAKRIRFLRKHYPAVTIVLHVDATQAPLHYSLNVQKLGIDLMTLGATKLYCPKGAGLLYVKRGTPLAPILHGGGQEFGLRPGTLAVQLIHDFAHALQYAQMNCQDYSEKILDLRGKFESLVIEQIPQAVITASDKERAPHISHIAVPNFDSELLVLELDARGIAVSAKSACKNDTNESDIVERIYGKGWGAIRCSFGRMTTTDDLEKAVAAFDAVLEKYS
jgi:cysteine desulfurase